jgi:GT2 family glycosyltransferase
MSRVSIVIPVHGRWDLTRPCLESLAAHLPGDEDIVLVDNGSWDETPEAAPGLGRSLFPDRFAYHAMESNAGFARACNRGAELAEGELVMFLNNDTFADHDFLTPLVRALEDDEGIGAAGPVLIYSYAPKIQHCGLAPAPGPKFYALHHAFPADHPLVRTRSFDYLTGACLLLPRELFLSLEGFDPGYMNGYEDLDLCRKLVTAGKRLVCVGESRLYHHTSATSGRFDREAFNYARFLERWGDTLEFDLHRYMAEDGYEFGVSEWLAPRQVVPGSRRLELLRLARGGGRDVLQALILKEPCWDEGYDLLARAQAEAGEAAKAARTRYFQAIICPSLDSFRHYVEASRTARIPGGGDETAALLTTFASPDFIEESRKRARTSLAQAEQMGDEDLARVYERWLAQDPLAAWKGGPDS